MIVIYRFNQNYGTFGLLDYLHSTNGAFTKNKAYERHFIIGSFSSARELIPD